MNLVTFIYIEDKEMTEELIAKKLSRIILLQGSKLNRSLDNRHIWILTTQICDEYRNQFIQYSWNRIGDGIKAVLGTSTSISIYLDEEKVYPKNHLKITCTQKPMNYNLIFQVMILAMIQGFGSPQIRN